MAIKLLLSTSEASVVLGPGGSTSREIGVHTGAKLHLSNRDQFYPGTQLQELTIRADASECVNNAAMLVVSTVGESLGKVSGGDHDVEDNSAKVRCIIPVCVAKMLIGMRGENIKAMRQSTGLRVHIEEVAIGSGDLAEQVVVLFGSFPGVQAGLPQVIEKCAEVACMPWFPQWMMTSHAGSETVTTTQVACSKGGLKGGFKGGYKGQAIGGVTSKGNAGFKGWGKDAEVSNWAPSNGYGRPQAGNSWTQSGSLDLLASALQRIPPGAAWPSKQRIAFGIPADVVSAVIGKGGAGTKEISGLTGATIMIRDVEGSEMEKSVIISGSVVGVAAAYMHVVGRITHAMVTRGATGPAGGGHYAGCKGGEGEEQAGDYEVQPGSEAWYASMGVELDGSMDAASAELLGSGLASSDYSEGLGDPHGEEQWPEEEVAV